MKKLFLLLIVGMLPLLTFAQSDFSTSSTDQNAAQILVSNGCVTLTPGTHNFGTQPVDFPSAPEPFYLQDGCNVSLIDISINAEGQAFSQTNNCGTTLPSGHFCTISVVFDPQSKGERSQNLVINYFKQGNPNPLQISAGLTGDGIDDVTFDPTSCSFGYVRVGQESFCTVTIQNQEPQRLTINRCQVSPIPPFSQDTGCPISLAKKGNNGDSVNILLDFRPDREGPASGTFAVTTNSPQEEQSGNPYTVILTGVGLPVCPPPMCCGGSGPCPPPN